MATRTISDLGGNYNATATWVEGVVPTSADDVVATATSGQLTVNVSSAARSIDLTLYTNTLTLNNNWTLNVTGLTHTFGTGMDFASTSDTARIIFALNATLVQNTTNRIPGLRFSGSTTKTLSTNIYCRHFDTSSSNAATANGNILYSNGDFGNTTGFTSNGRLQGTTKFILDGSGRISQTINAEVEIDTTGTYSTNYQGVTLGSLTSTAQDPILNIIQGNLTDEFFVMITKCTTGTQDVTISSSVKIPNIFIYNQLTNSNTLANRTLNITLIPTVFFDTSTPIAIENFSTLNVPRFGTSDDGVPIVNIFGGLSASNVYLMPSTRTHSSTSVFETTYKSIDLRLNSDVTHKIGNLMAVGGFIDDRPTISSITASVPCTINLANKEGSQIINYDFTDVIAGEDEIVAINGTLTGTTNITNVYPSGGGSSGGAWTFVS
jgi:hypothetical protein